MKVASTQLFKPFCFLLLLTDGDLYQYHRMKDQEIKLLQCHTCSSLISFENIFHKADQYSKDGSHEHEPN